MVYRLLCRIELTSSPLYRCLIQFFSVWVLLSVVACGSEQAAVNNVTTSPSLNAAIATPTLPPTKAANLPINTSSGNGSVTAISSKPTTQPALPQDWQSRWLKGIPCKPPCFEGITPGSTPVAEVMQLLKQNPLITSTQIYTPTGKPEFATISWNWIDNFPNSNGQTGIGGSAIYHAQTYNPSIYGIHINIIPYDLGEVIKAYGEPSHVVATFTTRPDKSSFYYHISIVYLSQGFVLSTRSSTIPTISSDLSLEQVDFFVPGVDGFFVGYPVEANKNLLTSWQGFKEFKFYCRGPNGGGCSQMLNP